jgi:NADH-quinone oxidoreductase subunit M
LAWLLQRVDFAAYTLWMFKRVYLGPVGNSHVRTDRYRLPRVSDLSLLAIAVLAMGLYAPSRM